MVVMIFEGVCAVETLPPDSLSKFLLVCFSFGAGVVTSLITGSVAKFSAGGICVCNSFLSTDDAIGVLDDDLSAIPRPIRGVVSTIPSKSLSILRMVVMIFEGNCAVGTLPSDSLSKFLLVCFSFGATVVTPLFTGSVAKFSAAVFVESCRISSSGESNLSLLSVSVP